ncbi:MFS transporter [Metabacillus litoralis]|jgi:MFS family permease|uniref:MFS transporter n=1 Tax=Metabacillus litoralis TaxID=152268 RepID=UPI00203D816D|nr:MFS transporter [Metabacillus litoralis]MCM3652847.1 MFS transporter [Metabacillus litoralis]
MSSFSQQASKANLWSSSFVFVMLANALLFLSFEMLLPTLPLFVSSIGGEATQIGLVTGIFMFSAILIRPFAGVLATRIDKKYLLLIGVAICALSTGAYYLSSGVWSILLVRMIHGIGFGLATTYFTTIAAENIPKERRGEGMGYFGVGETVAISLGPLIGVSLLQAYHFTSVFMSGMAILLLGLLLAVFISRKPRITNESSLKKDVAISFKLIEKRVLFPSLLILMTGISAGGILSFSALYAIEKGFQNVAWFFFIIAASSFLVRLISGKMFDKMGPGPVLIPSAFITIGGLIVLIVAQNELQFILAGFLYGFGFGAIFPALQTWCLNLVEEHEHENAIASFFNFFDLGIGGGSLLLGVVAGAFSYQAIYFVAIGAYVLYLLLYLGYSVRRMRIMKNSVRNKNKYSA